MPFILFLYLVRPSTRSSKFCRLFAYFARAAACVCVAEDRPFPGIWRLASSPLTISLLWQGAVVGSAERLA